MVDSHAVKTFKTDFQWIIDFSVKDGMAHWEIEQQEKFFDLLMRTGVKLNTDAEYIYTYAGESLSQYL